MRGSLFRFKYRVRKHPRRLLTGVLSPLDRHDERRQTVVAISALSVGHAGIALQHSNYWVSAVAVVYVRDHFHQFLRNIL
jgi:hypothetical protein